MFGVINVFILILIVYLRLVDPRFLPKNGELGENQRSVANVNYIIVSL